MPHFLVCYDIANPRRLGRVHREVIKYATLVQYSVYYYKGSDAGLAGVLKLVQAKMDESEDDVRAYAIPPLAEGIQLGRSWLPDELILPMK